MAYSRIVQTINGKAVNYISGDMTSADIAKVTALLEGSYDVYEAFASGGTAIATPAILNKQTYKVLKSNKVNGRETGIGTSFTVPHVKASKSSDDVVNAVVGVFDCSYDGSVACDKAYLKFDSSAA